MKHTELKEVLDWVDNVTAMSGLLQILGQYVDGSSRRVYFPITFPDVVIKVCFEDITSNIQEWEIWRAVLNGDMEVRSWLAPVASISDNGSILIQKRTQPIRPDQILDLPESIPFWIADMKVENWGWYDNRVVCHDYGNHKLYNALTSKRFVMAKWWSQDQDIEDAINSNS